MVGTRALAVCDVPHASLGSSARPRICRGMWARARPHDLRGNTHETPQRRTCAISRAGHRTRWGGTRRRRDCLNHPIIGGGRAAHRVYHNAALERLGRTIRSNANADFGNCRCGRGRRARSGYSILFYCIQNVCSCRCVLCTVLRERHNSSRWCRFPRAHWGGPVHEATHAGVIRLACGLCARTYRAIR
jgi:hypothetical protein